jgi:hypothetical protein
MVRVLSTSTSNGGTTGSGGGGGDGDGGRGGGGGGDDGDGGGGGGGGGGGAAAAAVVVLVAAAVVMVVVVVFVVVTSTSGACVRHVYLPERDITTCSNNCASNRSERAAGGSLSHHERERDITTCSNNCASSSFPTTTSTTSTTTTTTTSSFPQDVVHTIDRSERAAGGSPRTTHASAILRTRSSVRHSFTGESVFHVVIELD